MRKVMCFIFLALFSFVLLQGTFIYAQSGIKLEINGKVLDTETSPFIDNGTTMVPVRVVAESMGAQVIWDSKDEKFEITKQSDSIIFKLNELKAIRNGENIELSSAPILKDSQAFVPIRLITDTFNASVEWNDKTQTVSINFDDTSTSSNLNNSSNFFENRTYLIFIIIGLFFIVSVSILFFVNKKHNTPKCEFYNVRFIPFKRNKYGEFERITELKKAVLFEYSFNVDIVSPNNKKSKISSVMLIFKSFKSKVFSKPYQTRVLKNNSEDNVIKLGIKGIVKGSRIKILRKKFKLYFEGLYENGLKFKVKMLEKYKIDISESDLFN